MMVEHTKLDEYAIHASILYESFNGINDQLISGSKYIWQVLSRIPYDKYYADSNLLQEQIQMLIGQLITEQDISEPYVRSILEYLHALKTANEKLIAMLAFLVEKSKSASSPGTFNQFAILTDAVNEARNKIELHAETLTTAWNRAHPS